MTDILERIDWLYVAEIEAASPDPDMVKTYADAKAEIERLRGAENDAAEWVEERTKRLRADNARLRAALLEISEHMSGDWTGDVMRKIARRALEGKDEL